MVLTFGVAVGFTNFTGIRFWPQAILSAALAWIVLGLLTQSVDQWREYRGLQGLSNEQRWGWRFSIFWRVALALLLIACFIFRQLLARESIVLPEIGYEYSLSPFEPTGVASIHYLCLLIVLFSVQPRKESSRPTSIWSKYLDVLGVVGVLAIGLLHLFSTLTLVALVHIICVAVMLAQPGEIESHPVGRALVENWIAFSRWTALTSFVVILNVCAAMKLVRQEARGTARKYFWIAMLTVGSALCLSYLPWMYRFGLAGVSPFMAQLLPLQDPHRWVIALLLLSILATAATYRLTRRGQPTTGSPNANQRSVEHRYLHERPVVIATMVAALLVIRGQLLFELLQVIQKHGLAEFFAVLSDVVQLEVFDYIPALQYISIYLGLRFLYYRWWRKIGPFEEAPLAIKPGMFVFVWCGLFLTLATAVVAWAALGFALWMRDFW
jgi:hypothetical protein